MTAFDVMWVGLGGGCGALFRWWVGKGISALYPQHFPFGTFIINVSGAFLIGYLSTLLGVQWHDRYGHVWNAALLTGVLGGYTTFSSMMLDAANLVTLRARFMAFWYLLLSVVCGMGAAFCGIWLAQP